MHYENTKEIWDEVRSLCPNFYGATYEKMEGLGYAQWPITSTDPDDHGTPTLFLGGKFTTPDHKAHLMAHDWEHPTELPDEDYPLILCTVREVGHYSCRSMTGNCKALSVLADEPGFIQIHPEDAAARGIEDGQIVRAWSRRGETYTRAHLNPRINKGTVYMTYQWWVGKCNRLTLHHTDNRSHTPEDKFSACNVEAVADQTWAEKHVAKEYAELKGRLADEAAAQEVAPKGEPVMA
jgi:formate dehydrogenase major subunit